MSYDPSDASPGTADPQHINPDRPFLAYHFVCLLEVMPL
jgi:hypothetical protein